MFDFHMHTEYSFDAESSPAEMLAAAERQGLQELCFTDHIDLDGSGFPPADLYALAQSAAQLPSAPVAVRIGAEVSLGDRHCAERSNRYLEGFEADFIIGSVHLMEGIDPYEQKELFTAPKETVYRRYLECINQCIRTDFSFSVLGHYDYIAKCADYADRSFSLSIAPDLFDQIFDFLIARGRGLEINTASWRDGPAWGLDILRRYRERGGEYVTVGSDAHVPARVGNRIPEAIALARAAGIPYLATFTRRSPVLHRL